MLRYVSDFCFAFVFVVIIGGFNGLSSRNRSSDITKARS